jgi:hypothetical protein
MMSTEHRKPHDDLEWAEDRWARRPRAEPPELLDQAVRNAARRALPKPPRRRALPWIGGLATAGVMVLAVALVLRQDAAPEPSAPAADAPTASRAIEERAFEDEAMEAQPQQIMKRRSAGPESRLAGARFENDAARADEPDKESPEAWIRRLLALRNSGELDRLESELQAFKTAYPDVPLPPELDGL